MSITPCLRSSTSLGTRTSLVSTSRLFSTSCRVETARSPSSTACLTQARLQPSTSNLLKRSSSGKHLTIPALACSVPQRRFASATLWNSGTDETPEYEISAVPENPRGKGKHIRTAAALIIGDEILNGKTLDSNSHHFAKYCFQHGVELKRIEVIPDDETEIVEAARRLVAQYDFVVTSGGIGPTHDDITYPSLSRAFSRPLKHHQETLTRMRAWPTKSENPSADQIAARERMALFPSGEGVDVLFVKRDIWTPVVRLEGKLHILPGIPSLFQALLAGLTPFLHLPPAEERPTRIQVFTSFPESTIAPFLTVLQNRVKDEGIRIGSYPVLQKGVYVSLIGANKDRVREVSAEIQIAIEGREMSEQDIAMEKERSRRTGSA
ncbi:hypothetical protein FIBSPDRAFT_814648 [Athelia psychrophila]|uniref:MoaB/Mog domain-containing protein n=1 Tax=Athelia psychrophila TaxID=1759441 RepID=A0A166TPW7_9AGAM|nr:hypothetical protein FIBSPDRAFT_814648 [Fibularhizoctonia sp. CBS 109695]